MFLMSRLQNNLNVKEGYLLTLNSTRKDITTEVYSGSQEIVATEADGDFWAFLKNSRAQMIAFTGLNGSTAYTSK